MDTKYKVTVTSRDSAEVEDIALSPTDETSLRRSVIRPTIVNNIHESKASLQVTLIHQRRHSKKEPWKDVDAFNMATMKNGEEVRLTFGATETWRLKEALNQLYAIGQQGVPNTDEYIAAPAKMLADSLVIKGEARQVLEQLQENYGDDFWAALEQLKPDLLSTIALKRINDERRRAVNKFRSALEKSREAGKGTEKHWQDFFEENLWIFGHGLDYRILKQVTDQPYYGGKSVEGKGGQRGDYLMRTSSASEMGVCFTVLVEIKTPQSLLVEIEKYRNKTHSIGPDVSGGIAQLQSNCRTWVTTQSREESTAEMLGTQNVCTYEPKAILVVGDTAQLNTLDKKASFEMFRRNLHNPEILTFDELLARAEWIVEHGSATPITATT
jgi:hypothetical protein